MATDTVSVEARPILLQFGPMIKKFNDDEFFEFCQLNRDLRIERTSEGELIVMPPTGGRTGNLEYKLAWLFGSWAEEAGTGVPFGPSTGFILPNGAERSPDLAWVARSRWESLTARQQERFPPLCPDFVAEIRSPTDSLPALEAKMREYIDNGARLGWLIDPLEKKVHVYRAGAEPECLDHPRTLSGDPLLGGFVLDLDRLW